MLRKLCPATNATTLTAFVDGLNDVCDYYEISATKQRLAMCLGQLIHESGGFRLITENLNYSAARLMEVFPRYFSSIEEARRYGGKPEMIANRVYSNRMGNGPESSGDGWKFRGRGVIQLTGKFNYSRFAEGLGQSLEETVAYMETPDGAVSSAGWFWDSNDLNSYCDKNDFVGLTKRINGGTNGLADRLHHYKAALTYLNSV